MHNVNVEAVERTAARAEQIRRIADERCPGAWCVRNLIELHTHVDLGETAP